KGKDDKEARWTECSTTDPYGVVDLNKVIGKLKGTTAYACATVVSPREQQVEVRAGSINAIKVFLNGKQVFSREEYHHGMAMDQHVARVTLKEGRNELLVKVCQNEQTEDWAQDWKFQVRICDAVGSAVPVTVKAEKPGKGTQGGTQQ